MKTGGAEASCVVGVFSLNARRRCRSRNSHHMR